MALKCSKCGAANPDNARFCWNDGEKLIIVGTNPFRFRDGSSAMTLVELAKHIVQNWSDSIEHLYQGDFGVWLSSIGRGDLAMTARQIVAQERDQYLGLEKFLQKLEDDTPSPLSKPKEIINSIDGAVMILISEGEFLRGSPEGEGYRNECPQRTVYLNAYYIDKFEATNAQYRKFMKATGHKAPDDWSYTHASQQNHPVVGVSWYDAVAYAQWAGKRLPTESEWEKAARGDDGRKYPWGNSPPNAGGRYRANYKIDKYGTGHGYSYTTPVDNFPMGASPHGVMDMAGNVWEWCADWYHSEYYRTAPKKNPAGPSSGNARVLRGGGWVNDNIHYLRCAFRGSHPPSMKFSYVGFRCASTY